MADRPKLGWLEFQLPDLGRSPEGLPRVDTSGMFPDPWQFDVYRIERMRMPMGERLTLDEAQALVDVTCARFGRRPLPVEPLAIPVPAFEFDERTGHGIRLLFPRTNDGVVHVNSHMVLHEISHHLAVSSFQYETHGPLFLGYFFVAAGEHFGVDPEIWRREFASEGLHALAPAQVEHIGTRTELGPIDVENMCDIVGTLAGVSKTVRDYYAALPPSLELGARVERVYAENGVPTEVCSGTSLSWGDVKPRPL